MTTTPEQIASLTQAHTAAHRDLVDFSTSLERRVAAKEQQMDTFIADAAAHFPVSPNLLADTKRFEKLCGGQVNTPVEIIAGHGAPWSTSFYRGTQGNGSLTIVTLDQLDNQGIAAGGDLLKALGDLNSSGGFNGSDFRVALLEVTITGKSNNGETGYFNVLNQGCPTFTGWSRGEFTTQAACFINVIEQSGEITFAPHSNMPAGVTADASDAGRGWLYKQATRRGWGGCHQPRFSGLGHMKVALALPYIGFGDHRGRFVWAGSVGRYSHEDRLSAEYSY